MTTRAYFIERGEIRFSGAAEDLRGRNDLLRAVFLRGETVGAGRATGDISRRRAGSGG